VIDVRVPVRAAYREWAQFETFPLFMDGIVEVRRLDETFVHWVAEIDGRRREWDAEIVRQVPDRVIEWRSIDAAQPSGEVRFRPLHDGSTRIVVHMEYEPRVAGRGGWALRVDRRRVKEDLERFKDVVEAQAGDIFRPHA
jgi:uncharacterized membrane protein